MSRSPRDHFGGVSRAHPSLSRPVVAVCRLDLLAPSLHPPASWSTAPSIHRVSSGGQRSDPQTRAPHAIRSRKPTSKHSLFLSSSPRPTPRRSGAANVNIGHLAPTAFDPWVHCATGVIAQVGRSQRSGGAPPVNGASVSFASGVGRLTRPSTDAGARDRRPHERRRRANSPIAPANRVKIASFRAVEPPSSCSVTHIHTHRRRRYRRPSLRRRHTETNYILSLFSP